MRAARAMTSRIAVITARAGIHGGDEQKTGGKGDRISRATDHRPAFFQRLTQRFERIAAKLAKLVEEEHAVMGQTDFSGSEKGTTAHQGHARHRVMGRSHRGIAQQSGTGPQESGREDQ